MAIAGVRAQLQGIFNGFSSLLGPRHVRLRDQRALQRHVLEQEQLFRLMAISVVDYAILMLDPQGRVKTWNKGAERIKGHTDSEIIGRHFSCFYEPHDVALRTPWANLERAARDGHFEGEGWRLRKDGSRFWASVAISSVKDGSGRLLGYCKVTRDLTERKLAEEALVAQARERAEVSEKLRGLNASLEAGISERTAELRGTNAELMAAKAALQQLSSRLITTQEEERRHIARELHDEAGQSLTLIRLQLAELQREAPAKAVDDCIALVHRTVDQIRRLSLNLRPPMLDDLGLVDALEWALEQQATAAGWRSSLSATGCEERRFAPEIETACFRIGQEALTNAARHARASEVTVTLRLDGDDLELGIADNGQGFDLARYQTLAERKQHFGLVSMTERAKLAGGSLAIDTAPGAGARIRVRFPLAGQGDTP